MCFEKKWSYDDFECFFNNSLVTLWGYWDNAILVGFVAVTIIGNEAEIYTLCTHPHYRHKNIASQLLNTTKQECQSRLVTHLFLEVSVNNSAAIECYKKNNFQIITTRKHYYTENNNPVDAFVMQTDLL
jgi:ribosomal-protein-alanine N-acetyltransferase